jgi:hypothetical protein
MPINSLEVCLVNLVDLMRGRFVWVVRALVKINCAST